ncbi:MAG: hypothetical protein HQL19_03730 [Candidatus Omnitrophica bacterium]|nr:hypothetical protein [Candidatus Omnitrophota bacterium]
MIDNWVVLVSLGLKDAFNPCWLTVMGAVVLVLLMLRNDRRAAGTFFLLWMIPFLFQSFLLSAGFCAEIILLYAYRLSVLVVLVLFAFLFLATGISLFKNWQAMYTGKAAADILSRWPVWKSGLAIRFIAVFGGFLFAVFAYYWSSDMLILQIANEMLLPGRFTETLIKLSIYQVARSLPIMVVGGGLLYFLTMEKGRGLLLKHLRSAVVIGSAFYLGLGVGLLTVFWKNI